MNTIVSFDTAKWLESIGFPQNNLKSGYATDIEKDLIAAPTVEDAFNFIKRLNFFNFFEAATGLNEIYFRVCKCEYVIIHETTPADSYDEALKNLLEDKSVQATLKARVDMFK